MKTSFVFYCLFVFVSASILEAQVVTDGLVCYWTMDKEDIDDKTLKDVVGAKDGTIVGNPESVPGHLDEALEFHGAPDRVDLPQILKIGKNPVSYECWFKKTNTNSWQYLIANKSDFNSNFFRFGFHENTGQIRFYTEHENEQNSVFITTEDYADDEWHHVVGTREESEGKIYVDGSLVKEGPAMTGDIGGDKTIWYLAQQGASGGNLIGSMDEVRIYSRALTEEEVKQNFESKGLAFVDTTNKLSITWGAVKTSR